MSRLIRVYFLNTLKLNNLKKGENRGKAWGFLFLMIFVVFSMLSTMVAYSYLLGSALESVGALEVLPALFMTVASIFALISVLFTTKGILFAFKDFDSQMSFPISAGKVVASRITILYLYELIYTLVIMVPSLAVYAGLARPGGEFYPIALITLLFIPIIPIVIGVLLGTLISIATARFRKANAARIIVLFLFSLFIMAVSFAMQNVTNEAAEFLKNTMHNLYRRYPPVMLYAKALSGDLLNVFIFIAVSLALFVLFSLVVGRIFKKVNTSITAVYTRRNYRLTGIRESGAQSALFIKELKTYFGSVLYVLNTAFGMIILLIVSIAIIVLGPKGVENILNIPLSAPLITNVLPLAICLIISLSSTSAVSISIEGSRYWLLKTLPVSHKQIFIAKIGVNLAVTVPITIISAFLISLALKPGLPTVVFMFLTPLAYCLFTSVVGLTINLFTPKLKWKNEAEVIKQSSSVLFTMLIGFAASGLPLYFMFTTGSIKIMMATTVAVLLVAVLLLIYLMRYGGKKLYSLTV
ncbi:MAG: hypothetical protein GX254_00920 [Clostridiales bacterium]|jgi:ABC-2 type transport system permease protein|nr:hypothetical protein [Clostridiales bacterium]